jgi:nucleotide-binding universal stress UspA family protein
MQESRICRISYLLLYQHGPGGISFSDSFSPWRRKRLSVFCKYRDKALFHIIRIPGWMRNVKAGSVCRLPHFLQKNLPHQFFDWPDLFNSYIKGMDCSAYQQYDIVPLPDCLLRFLVVRWKQRSRRWSRVNVLLATDGSECSDAAALFLTRLKLLPEDRIIIVHVVSEVPYEDEYHAQVKRVIKRVAPKILSSASDILKGVKAKVSVVEKEGYPDTTIVESAVSSDADLIVMGARGIKGVKLVLLGSVTRSVVNSSPKPILVVKRPGRETPRNLKILFATDGSESAFATAGLLAVMPFYDDFEITILNVQRSAFYDIPERFAMEVDNRVKEAVASRRKKEYAESEKILEDAARHLTGKYANLQTVTKFGDPSYEILATAEQMNADIVAVGCRGLRGMKGILGSVSRNILIHAKSSVLIGKLP